MPRWFIISLIVLATLVGYPTNSAGQEMIDVIFARDVVNREPIDPFQPGAYCGPESAPSGSIPVIDSQQENKVYLWNRVKSQGEYVIRHRWLKDGVEVAMVELDVAESPGWRTWSSKNIDPNFHIGSWKVEVTTASNPSNVICIAHFIVK